MNDINSLERKFKCKCPKCVSAANKSAVTIDVLSVIAAGLEPSYTAFIRGDEQTWGRGDEQTWGTGPTEVEAIGELIIKRSAAFNIKIIKIGNLYVSN